MIPTPKAAAVLRKITTAILDGINAAGDEGAPADVLYGALKNHLSHDQFVLLMGMIERDGLATSADDLYYLTPAGAAFAAESTTGIRQEHRIRPRH
jgi:hypothetical protein